MSFHITFTHQLHISWDITIALFLPYKTSLPFDGKLYNTENGRASELITEMMFRNFKLLDKNNTNASFEGKSKTALANPI